MAETEVGLSFLEFNLRELNKVHLQHHGMNLIKPITCNNMKLFHMTQEITQILKEHYVNTPESLQDVLILLRKMGISQIESIKIIMHELDLNLKDANEIVSSSKAWNSRLDEL